MDIKADLLNSWDLNNKVTLYLLDHIDTEWLSKKLNGTGRSISEQFLHINNIRSFWIGKVNEKIDLKLDKKYAKDKKKLEEALQKSAQKMKETLSKIFEQESIRGYKPHPVAFFSQMIAHESHHRGQIIATITRNDLPIDKSVNFGLWNWNNK
ncbi:DinB family protein [Flavivirga algicola]|uniref:DinB family protein n=1 Tax=Flavivirga algicola TaxID=2729136 RepID=A0ABX1S5P1_9FLAO|nr:DinB family protein [Flavivirga algicola]NMH89962.1 DinB family protein [Flavivirga algicola]